MAERRNLVYIGLNRWESIWQRPHHLAQRLSQTFRVLYVDPVAYSMLGYLNNRLRGDGSRNLRSQLRSINENLFVFTPPPLLPFSMGNDLINRLDHVVLAHMVRRVLHQLNMHHPVLWLTYPAHLPLVGAFGETLVCYDCMDNYPAFHPPGSARARLAARQQTRLLSKVDLVVTTALSLQQQIKAQHPHVYLVRNAVGEQFLNYQPNPPPDPPTDWPATDGPVIGYMGAIARWFDFEAIVQVASRHPDWRLVVIGPAEVDLTPYQSLPNLHFLGQKPYHELTTYVARFDIGIIPFLMNELTVDVNPVKAYEYFALGKPVVTTALPELLPFADACYLAADTTEFVQQLERAVENLEPLNTPEAKARRRAIAQANTWHQRADEILHILEAHLGGEPINMDMK